MNNQLQSKGISGIIVTVIGAVLILAVTTSWRQITDNAERSVRNEEKVLYIERTIEGMDKKLDIALKYIYSRP